MTGPPSKAQSPKPDRTKKGSNLVRWTLQIHNGTSRSLDSPSNDTRPSVDRENDLALY